MRAGPSPADLGPAVAPGITPSYEQKAIDPAAVANKLVRIAAPEPGPQDVRLVQDAEIWTTKLDEGAEVTHPLKPGRRAWVQVARGEVDVNGQPLKQGDAAGLTDEPSVELRARVPAEILLFDLA